MIFYLKLIDLIEESKMYQMLAISFSQYVLIKKWLCSCVIIRQAIDTLCGAWGRGWTTCNMRGGPILVITGV